jgi:hypothetical protein
MPKLLTFFITTLILNIIVAFIYSNLITNFNIQYSSDQKIIQQLLEENQQLKISLLKVSSIDFLQSYGAKN